MKILKKILSVNLTQFVPAIIIAALIVTSVAAYKAPDVITAPVISQKDVNAKTTEEKNDTKVNVGSLDLSKVKDGTYEGSGTGFRGTVKVSVTVKNHKITGIDVLSYADDSSFFSRAKSGVIANILSKQSLSVDTVSGATYSSKGILSAVKNALTGEVDNSTAAGAGTAADKGKASKLASVSDANATYKDGTYKGSGKGFGGTTTVAVTIKNGKIKSIKVVSHHDTASYFKRAKSKVISAIVKKQTTNVDTVSGATYSSNGIIKAVRKALAKAKTGDKSGTSSDTKTDDTKVVITGKLSGKHNDGTYTGSADGYGGTTVVSITIKNNQLTAIKLVSNEDTPSFFSQAKAVVNKILKKQSTKVDVVSGATYSSNGIINAVKDALAKAEPSSTSDDDKKAEEDTKKEDTDQKDSEESKESVVKTYSTTVTVVPDEYEDFYDYDITVTATVTDGIITEITTDASGTDSINKFYTKRATTTLAPKLANLKNGSSKSVDVVSGATCSSNAILEAYEKLVNMLK